MMQKAKTFIIPIINVEVSILVGDSLTIDAYIQDLHNKTVERPSSNTVASTFFSNDIDTEEYLYIALYSDVDIKDSAYNIIHECLHVAHKACMLRGIEIDEEFLCYLQGFLINKVLECLNAELTVVINPQLTVEDIPRS